MVNYLHNNWPASSTASSSAHAALVIQIVHHQLSRAVAGSGIEKFHLNASSSMFALFYKNTEHSFELNWA